jgi:hypothetical protein
LTIKLSSPLRRLLQGKTEECLEQLESYPENQGKPMLAKSRVAAFQRSNNL